MLLKVSRDHTKREPSADWVEQTGVPFTRQIGAYTTARPKNLNYGGLQSVVPNNISTQPRRGHWFAVVEQNWRWTYCYSGSASSPSD